MGFGLGVQICDVCWWKGWKKAGGGRCDGLAEVE